MTSLPIRLTELAAHLLPTSELYEQALRSSDALDESEVALFDGDPPYVLAPHDEADSEAEASYTLKMVDVASGRRARLEMAYQEEVGTRADTFDSPSGFGQFIEQELMKELNDWKGLAEALGTYTASRRHVAMAHVQLEWRARRVSYLFNLALEVREGDE